MHKISTPVTNPDNKAKNELQPRNSTLQNILQFAAVYRSVQMNENQQVVINLN